MPNESDGDETGEELDQVAVLRVFVQAHSKPDPRTGTREAVWYLRFHGDLMHHALPDPQPAVDDALIEEMRSSGLIDLDYSGSDGNTWKITPTPKGRAVVEEEDRSTVALDVDTSPLLAAIHAQAAESNPLAWPAVRPVLDALRRAWIAAGYVEHGVPIRQIVGSVPDEQMPLFGATLRALVRGGYLEKGMLVYTLSSEAGSVRVPGEVALTDKAHTVLDGWPGAPPSELVENLLAVLAAAASNEPDPVRRGRLEAAASAVRDLGVSVASDVIAKVITGGIS